MANFPPVSNLLKPCQAYMKLASDHEKFDPAVTYWCRLYAFQMGLKIDTKSKENKEFLSAIMTWLEDEKKKKISDETITSEVVAQAHIENYGIKLFNKADLEDRKGNGTKNIAKLFFTAAQLFDLLNVFGEANEEFVQKSKYSKWRAAYIIKCVKSGEKPLPPEDENKEENPDQNQNLENIGIDKLNINNYETENVSNEDEKNKHTERNSDESYEPQSLFSLSGTVLTQEDILKSKKFCKWAMSSLDYDDIKTAAANLKKALNILTIGKETELS